MHETIHFLNIHSEFKDSGQGFGINHLKIVAFVYVYVCLLLCTCTVCMRYNKVQKASNTLNLEFQAVMKSLVQESMSTPLQENQCS